jgi:hypothetical protein
VLAASAVVGMMVAACGQSNSGSPSVGQSESKAPAASHSSAPASQPSSAEQSAVTGGSTTSGAKPCNLMSTSAIDAFTGAPEPNALVPNAIADANDNGVDYSCKFEYWSGGAANAGTMTLRGMIEFVCGPSAVGNPAVTYPNSRFFKIGSMPASIVVGLNSNKPGTVPASVLNHAMDLAKAEGC